MKKYIFGSLIVAAGMMASCSLDENPESAFFEKDAMQSETLIYLNTVAAVYNNIGNCQQTYGVDASGFVSDEFFIPGRLGDWVDGGVPQNKFTHNIMPSHGSQGNWANCYEAIALANSAIAKLEGYADQMEAAKEYIYELRAFRAMLYYTLCDHYGVAPLVTSASQSVSDTKSSTRKEIFDFAVSELTECLPYLSTDQSQKSGVYYGRMTQPVAYMVLAKLALNASVFQLDVTQPNWAKDYLGNDMSGEEKIDEAQGQTITNLMKNVKMTIDGKEMNSLEATIYCVDKLENDFGYRLASTYTENFIVNNENSVENIWTIPNDAETYKRSWDHHRRSWHYNHAGHSVYKGFSSWNGPCATRHLAEVYGYTTDKQDLSTCDPRFEYNFYIDRDYVEETGERVSDGFNNDASLLNTELALEYMPLWPVIDMSSSEAALKAKKPAAYSSFTDDQFFQHVVKSAGARFRKYAFDFTTSNASYPGNDLVVFRFADAKLMRAEAEYRLGETAKALQEVNDTRARVGLPALTEVSLQVIGDERQKELAWEGTRRQDMIRYAILNEPTVDRYVGVPVNVSASPYDQTKMDGHTYVWPVPANQIATNTNLTQAWGY